MTEPVGKTKSGIRSRADLVDLLSEKRLADNRQLFDAIGFQFQPKPTVQVQGQDASIETLEFGQRDSQSELTTNAAWTQFQPAPTQYWRVIEAHYKIQEEPSGKETVGQERTPEKLPGPDKILAQLTAQLPKSLGWKPLAKENDVVTRLRQLAAANRSRLETDIPKAVRLISQGEFLQRIPKRARKVWGHDLLVFQDRSRRLVPYWKDQDLVTDWLWRIYPESGLQIARLQEKHANPTFLLPHSLKNEQLSVPHPGTLVLAMTDLGVLDTSDGSETDASDVWLRWGRKLRDNGNQAVALIPCGRERIPGSLAGFWDLIPWDRSQQTAAIHGALTLQRLVALCVRLEPKLLRVLRQLIPAARFDPGLEAEIWQSELLDSMNSSAAPVNLTERKRLLAEAGQIPVEIREEALRQIGALRLKTGSTFAEELMSLDASLPASEDIQNWVGLAYQMVVSLNQNESKEDIQKVIGWIAGMNSRMPAMPNLPESVRQALEKLAELVPRKDGISLYDWQSDELKWQAGTEKRIRLSISGDSLRFLPLVPPPPEAKSEIPMASSSFLADIRSVNGEIRLIEASDEQNDRLRPAEFWEFGQEAQLGGGVWK